MRKEDLISDVLYLLMAAIVLLVGFLVISPAINAGLLGRQTQDNILFILVALIVGIILNVILMEVGHLIGAKIGGYKILSVNILGLNFYRDFSKNTAKGELKFRFKGFNGLTGETIIEPKKEKSNPMFYVFFPLILFLLEFVAMYLAVNLVPADSETYFETNQIIKYGLIVSTTIAGCIVLYDYFPAKLDTLNDGYRLVSLKDKINILAYNEKLKLEANEYKGIKNTEFKVFDEITDFTAKVNEETALQKLIDGNGEEGINILDKCLADTKKVSLSTQRDLALNKVYLAYLTKGIDEGNALYNLLDERLKEYVKTCKTLSAIRVYTLYIALTQKSGSEVKYAVNKARKIYDRLTVGEIDKETTLLLLALKMIVDFDATLVEDAVVKEACNNKDTSEKYKEFLSYKTEALLKQKDKD